MDLSSSSNPGKTVPIRVASAQTGYSKGYIASLCRTGKVKGAALNGEWFVDRASLEAFIADQAARKAERAKNLAEARAREFRAHQGSADAPVRKVSVSADIDSQPLFIPRSIVSEIVALSTATIVILLGAVGAHAEFLPRAAESAGAIAVEAAHGFALAFGDLPKDISARIENASRAFDENGARVSEKIALGTASVAVPALSEPDFSRMQMALAGDAASQRMAYAPLPAADDETQVVTVADLKKGAAAAVVLASSPADAREALVHAYVGAGEAVYGAARAALSGYQTLLERTGAASFTLAVDARDGIARYPRFVDGVNRGIAAGIANAAHAAIRADVSLAYGLAAAGPESARATVAFIGGIGVRVAGSAAAAPRLASSVFLKASAYPAEAGPALAAGIFNAEYALATGFVGTTNAVTERYLAFVNGTGELAYGGARVVSELARSASGVAMVLPASAEDAYLGALGQSALALSHPVGTFLGLPPVAAALDATANGLSVGARFALTTYQTIHGAVSTATNGLAALFAPRAQLAVAPTAPLPDTLSREASVPDAPQPAKVIAMNSYPSYTTIVRGVTETDLDASLAALRTELLRQFGSALAPVAAQTITNVTTIQQVNRIQDLTDLIVRNGDLRGGTFDGGKITNASSIDASTGTFGSLVVGGAGGIGVGGNVTANGRISGSYFTATSTTATSTFSGSVAIDTNGFVYATSTRNVGIGVLSPAALLAIANSNGSQPIFTATNAAGAEVYRITDAGFVGIGSTTPGYNLAVEGASSLGNSATAGYFTATTSATSTFAGRLAVGTSSPWGNGILTVGTTTPLLYVDSTTGYIGVGSSAPVYTLDVSGNARFASFVDAASFVATSSTATSTFAGGLAVGTTKFLVDSTTGYVGIATSSPAQLLSVGGNGYFTGGVGIGIATSTAGVLQTSSDAYIGGNLTVVGNSTVLGSSLTNTLAINSSITSNVVPNQNATYDLGSPSYFWRNIYVGTLTANNISAASTTIGGTQSETFTINSDNATADTEDMSLIFYRGTVVPNAVETWNSTRDRFEFNQPMFVQNDSASTTIVTFDVKGTPGQTADLLRVASSSGSTFFNVAASGYVGIGTANPQTALDAVGNLYVRNVAGAVGSNDGVEIATDSSAPRVSLVEGGRYVGLFSGDAPGNTYLKNVAGGDLIFTGGSGGNVELARLSNGGSLGIGTTTPWGQLSVNPNGITGPSFVVGSSTATNFIVGNDGKVGIGTASPQTTFHVEGSGAADILLKDSAQGSGLKSFLIRNSSANLYIGRTDDSFTSTVAYLTIQNGGNVGLGTTTPAVALDIYSTGAIRIPVGTTGQRPGTGDVGFIRYNLSNHQFEGYGDSGVWQGLGGVINPAQTTYITADSSDILHFVTASAERMTIGATGLIGVGSTTPFARFGITGAAGGTDTLFAISTSTAAFATTTALTVNANGDLSLNNGANLTVGGNASVTGNLTVTGTTNFRGSFNPNAGANVLLSVDGTGAIVGTSSPSVAAVFATSTTATSTFAGGLAVGTNQLLVQQATGFVGLGVTNPGERLTVAGNVRALASGAGNGFLAYDASTGGTHIFSLTRQTNDLAVSAYGGIGFATNKAGGPSSSYAAYIDTNGRLGLGTTTPAVTFDIYATDALRIPVGTTGQRPATGDTGFIRYNTTTHQFEGYGDNAVWQGLGGVINAAQTSYVTADSSDILHFVTSSTERMTIGATGLIGIGSTTPYARFGITGAAGDSTTLFAVSTSTASFATSTAFYLSAAGNGHFVNGSGLAIGYTNTPPGSGLLVSGNVGIGTTGPNAKVEISSGVSSGDTELLRLSNTSGNGYSSFTQYRTNSGNIPYGLKIATQGGVTFDIQSDAIGGDQRFLFSNGSVGIGTTTPYGLLSVNPNGITGPSFVIGSSTATSFIVTNGGKIGIGTTSPSYPLSVNGTIYTNTGIRFPDGSVQTAAAASGNAALAGQVSYYAVDGSTVSGTSTLFVANTGRVGIGTTSPLALLDVSGTNAALGEMILQDNQTTSASGPAFNLLKTRNYLSAQNNDSAGDLNFQIFNTALARTTVAQIEAVTPNVTAAVEKGQLKFSTMNAGMLTEAMRITDTGYVGVGSTTPYGLLSVNPNGITGPALVVGSSTATSFVVTSAGNVSIGTAASYPTMPLVVQNSGTGTTVNSNIALRLQSNGTGYASTLQFSDNVTNAASISMINGDFNFLVPGFGTTPSMVLKATSGNVGIGTTSPSQLLSVSSSSNKSAYFAGYVGIGISVPTAELHVMDTNGDGVSTIRVGNSGRTFNLQTRSDITSNGFAIADDTAGAYRFVIDGSGNVGINTSTPSSKFEVNGDIRITSGSGGRLYFADGTSMNTASAAGTGTTSWSDLNFQTGGAFNFQTGNGSATSTKFAITNAGNVGIGTASPAYKLLVHLGTDQNIQFRSGLEVTGDVGLNAANDADSANVPFSFIASKFILAGGNVGIGTTSPDQLLSINSANTSTNSLVSYQQGGVTQGYSGFGTDNILRLQSLARPVGIQADGAQFIFLQTNGSERVRIDSSGNVGIGTTTPTTNLSIQTSTNGAGISLNGTSGVSPTLRFYKDGANQGGIGTVAANDTYGSGTLVGDMAIVADGGAGTGNIDFVTNNANSTWAVRQVITAAGNVGIGTTTPLGKLTVQDTGNVRLDINSNSSTGQQFISFDQAGTAQWQLLSDFSANGTREFDIRDVVSGANRLHINSSGNVGIGTTNPNQGALDVVGTIAAQSADLSYLGQFYADSSGLHLSAYAGGGLPLIFATTPNGGGATERMRIDSTGNVGIGTTTPDTKLSVNGTSKFGNGAWPTAAIGNSGGRVGMFSDTEDGYLFIGNMQSGVGANRGGQIYLGARQTAANADMDYASIVGARENATDANASTYLAFTTSGGNERMRIDGSGNIGIGTTSISRLLTLYKSGSTVDEGILADAAQSAVLYLGDANTAVYRPAGTTDLRLFQGGADVLSLKSGNVGIGTTNPGSKLEVNGDIRITSGSGGKLYFADGTSMSTASAAGSGTTSWNDLNFQTGGAFNFQTGNGSATSTVVTVTNAGKVGIGTATPGTNDQLTIAGSSGSALYTTLTNSSTGDVGYHIQRTGGTTSDAYLYIPSGSTDVRLYNGGGDRLTVNSSGNVGIGTTTPSNTLDVTGGARIYTSSSGTAKSLTLQNTVTTGYTQLQFTGTGRSYTLGVGNASETTFGEANKFFIFDLTGVTPRLTIDSSGNVGIGTTTPNRLLTLANAGANNQLAFVDTGASANQHIGTIGFSRGGFNFNTESDAYASTTRMVINSSGNVGIGTSTPGAKLAVNGDAVFGNIAGLSYGGQTLGIQANSNIPALFVGGNGTTGQSKGLRVLAGTNTSDYALDINDYNGNIILRATGAGNVSIGATSPDLVASGANRILSVKAPSTSNAIAELQLEGDQTSGSNITSRIIFAQANGGGYFSDITGYRDGGDTSQGLMFGTYGSGTRGTRMTITGAGNVGIGTTTPPNKLTITGAGSSLEEVLSLWNGTQGQKIGFHPNNGAQTATISSDSNGSNAYLAFSTDGTERMRIAYGGNVGIGTASPSYKLDVNGSLNATAITINGVAVGTGSTQWSNSGANIYYNGGNVSIGTTGSSGRLTIQGTKADAGTYNDGLVYITDDSAYAAGVGGAIAFSGKYDSAGDYATGGSVGLYKENGIDGNYNFGLEFTTRATGGGASRKMVITGAGNVGIGTSTPSNMLQVAGGITATGAVAADQPNAVSMDYVGTSYGRIYVNGPDTSTNGSLRFVTVRSGGTNSLTPLTIASSGNIGIGTTTPGAQLSVTGANASRDLMSFDVTSPGDIAKFSYDASASPYPFTLTLGASRPFAITGGNVGIGTSSPTEKLDVNGNISIESSGAVLFRSSGSQIYSPATNSLSIYTNGSDRVRIDSSGNVGIGTTTPNRLLTLANAGANNQFAFVDTGASANQHIGTIGFSRGGFNFNTESDAYASTTRMVINSSGYVGIGTTTPHTYLELAGANVASRGQLTLTGSDYAQLTFYKDSSTETFAMYQNQTGGDMAFSNLVTNGNIINIVRGTGNFDVQGTNGNVMIVSGAAPASSLTVNSSGYVGLGTASAYKALEVHAGTNQNILVRPASEAVTSATGIAIQGYNDAHNATVPLALAGSTVTLSGSGSADVTVNSSGNVGIGTTTQTNMLDVAGNVGWANSTGAYRGLLFTSPSGQYVGLEAVNNTALVFGTNDTERMRITSTGNVGIGTSTPSRALEVSGTTGISRLTSTTGTNAVYTEFKNTSGINLIGNESSAGGTLFVGSSAYAMALGTVGAYPLQFGTNNNIRATIDSSGNVGIGTTSPSNLLSLSSSSGEVQLTNQGQLWGYQKLDVVTAGLQIKGFSNGGGTNTQTGAITIEQSATGSAGGYINFLTNNGTSVAEAMRITSAGSVGIGTTTPNAGGHTVALTISNLGSGARSALEIQGNTNNAHGVIDFYNSGALTGYIEARGADGSANINLMPDASVGIGTASPAAKLSVATGVNNTSLGAVGLNITATSTAFTGDVIPLTFTGLGGTARARAGIGMVVGSDWGKGDLAFYTRDASDASLLTTSDEKMRINSAGSVGIGTASPQARLNVVPGNGVEGLRVSGSSNTLGISLAYTDAGTTHAYISNLYAGSTASDIQFQFGSTLGSGTVMTLLKSGNVGIGTTGPSAKLEVDNTTGGDTIFAYNTATSGTNFGIDSQVTGSGATLNEAGLFIATGGSSNYGIHIASTPAAANNYAIYSDAAAQSYFAGKVGISTASPADPLEVEGNLRVAANSTYYGQLRYSGGTMLSMTTPSTETTDNMQFIINGGSTSTTGNSFVFQTQTGNTTPATVFSINKNGAAGFNATPQSGYTQTIGFTGSSGLVKGTQYQLTSASSGTAIEFFNSPSVVGSVTMNTTNTAFNTSSDRRVKENIATSAAGLSTLLKISVDDFNFTYDPSKTRVQGFIAQDLYQYYPVAVTTNGDNGTAALSASATPWQVDYGRVTPLLARAVQQLASGYTLVSPDNGATSTIQSFFEGTTTPAITVDASGNVAIGKTTAAHTLDVAGDVAAISFVNTSTRTMKTDISYEDASSTADMLTKLMEMKIATYRYTIESQNDPLRLGLIAEDVQQIAPEVLSPDQKGVDIYKLATFTLGSVQALAAKVADHETRIASLESRVAALESGAVSSASGTISFSTSTLASALESFGVLIQKGIAQFNTLVFRQLVASKDADGTSSAGSVTILAGNTVAQVNNSLVTPTTKVFVTFNTQVNGSWWVSDKQAGSFRVVLSAAQGADVSFDYFLVQTEGQIATPNGDGTYQGVSVSQSSGPDTEAPVITLLGDNPLYLAVGAHFSDPGVTVTDNADGTDAVTAYVNGVQETDVASAIDTSSPATFIITYRAMDKAGNTSTAQRSVIVGNPDGVVAPAGGTTSTTTPSSSDTTAPVVSLTGSAAMQLTLGDAFTDPGATATDDTDGDLTAKIVETGSVDTATAGLYTLTYSATDAAGNTGSVSRAVSVVASSSTATTTAP